MRNDSNWRAGSLSMLGAASGAALVALAWRADARWRRRERARLHRVLVDLLLNTLSAGDPVTERHSRRVADLADIVFATYPFGTRDHATLRLAALLHDMGKIDDRFFDILHSCEPLSDEERQMIEEHPHESADILQPLEAIHPGLSRLVESHHECWDGDGYPNGLSGSSIPLGARIISVADVFDALTQPRAYRKALSVDEAMKELERGSGTRFDPSVVQRVEREDVRREWRKIVERGRLEEGQGKLDPVPSEASG